MIRNVASWADKFESMKIDRTFPPEERERVALQILGDITGYRHNPAMDEDARQLGNALEALLLLFRHE